MPVAKEKGRRRNVSTGSDCGLQAHFSPTRAKAMGGEWELNDTEGDSPCAKPSLSEAPFPVCCSPKSCLPGDTVDPASPEVDSVKMQCSNDKCPYSPWMHHECFVGFEEQMLSCLRGMSRARNWSEKQRRQNLWTKKGYDLIYKLCTCRCAKGTLKKDMSMSAESADKLKRKRKRSLVEKMAVPNQVVPNGIVRSRARSGRNNSDSVSSENGTPYMQPFSHRTGYKIFEQLVPHHLVNSYHIKMEDDGYGAGDDTRSFVLSSLAFHRTSQVMCVLCRCNLCVYDQFPLIDGTFYLSPLKANSSSYEVESKTDDPLYLSAVCLKCLVGINKVTCTFCSGTWNGNAHQIGTMYNYDIFASLPCCKASMECNKCRQQLLEPTCVTLSFSQLSQQHKCPHCSTSDYHFIKPITRFTVKVQQQQQD